MANIMKSSNTRRAEVEHVMKTYGIDKNDPAMREAAEIAVARTHEAVKRAENRRRYY